MADTKISGLTSGSPAVAADELPVSRTANTATRRVTAQSVANLVRSIDTDIALTGDISPAQLTGDQNDWNPTNLSTASTIRVDTDRVIQLTGLAGGADGRLIVLRNVSSTFSDLLLRDQHSGSSAANRFALPYDFLRITTHAAVLLQYDATDSLWRVISAVPNMRWTGHFAEDEFLNHTGSETGEIGSLGWTSGAGTISGATAGEAQHAGIVNLSSSATINTVGRLTLGTASASGVLLPQNLIHMATIVRPTVADADANYRWGLMQDASVSATSGTSGCYFTYDQGNNGNSNWWFRSRNASTNTNTDTGVALTANNWYLLEIVREGAGAMCGYINGVRVARHTTNNPTPAQNVGYIAQTDAAAAKTIDIDYFSIRLFYGQRWT